MAKAWLLLLVAILSEVVGTLALKRTEGMTRLAPTLVMLISYSVAVYLLTLTVRHIPTSIVYAVWSGVGLVLITLGGFFFNGDKLTWGLVLGVALILAGVMVLNLTTQRRNESTPPNPVQESDGVVQ